MEVIFGKVRKGKGIGKTMGFPTLNLEYNGGLRGVFAGRVFINDKPFLAALSVGSRPTFSDPKILCEAYILNWEGNISEDIEIKIEVLKKIRNIEKFENLEELKKRIKMDVEIIKGLYD